MLSNDVMRSFGAGVNFVKISNRPDGRRAHGRSGQGSEHRLEIDILYFFDIECKNSLLFFSLSIGAFPYFFARKTDIN